MRNLFVTLGFIAAALTLILATSPFLQTAYFTAIVALFFGFLAFYLSKEKNTPKKSIQLIFLLTAIALVLTTYKTFFRTPENENPDDVEPIEISNDNDGKTDSEVNEIREISRP